VPIAICPCCGSKESIPDGSLGRRALCSNCGTPFVAGAAPPAPAEPQEAAPAPMVEVIPVAVPLSPPPPKKKPPRPPSPARPPSKSRPAPAAKLRRPPEDQGLYVPPPSSPARRRKKSRRGCAVALGCLAFAGVLTCGGLGAGAWYFWDALVKRGSLAEVTSPEDAGTEKKTTAKETEYVEAGKPGRLGDVRVTVNGAAVDYVTGMDKGAEFKSQEKLLAIKLRLDNVSETRKIEYVGWGGAVAAPGDELPRLTDEHGKGYRLVTFGGDRRVGGQVRSVSVGPRGTVNDILVFDAPADDAKVLKLDLSGRNFGGTGHLGFRLSRLMIRFGDQPGGLEKAKSVPDLIDELKDSDPKTRLAAANTLAAGGPASALATRQLGETLKDVDPTVRLAAARALGRIGLTAHVALPALVRALGDKDEAVRKAAREALGKIGDPNRGDVADLSAALKEPSQEVRTFALQGLLSIELDAKTAATVYAAVVKDPDRAMRLQAVRGLGKVGPKQRQVALPALLEALRDSDAEVRKVATEAMVALGPAAAGDVPALRAALKERNNPPELRAQAAKSLGGLGAGARAAVPELTDALRSPDVIVRRAAAGALAQVGTAAKDALVPLMDALQDKDKDVRRAGLDAVGKLGAEGKIASTEVAALLADADPELRKLAGQTLRQIDPGAVLGAYGRALFHPSEAVRLDAVDALVAMGPDARPRTADFIAALDDKNLTVRLKAARALTKIDPKSSAPVSALASLLSSGDVAVRREAAEALVTLGPVCRDAVPALRVALKDKDAAVRRSAVAALDGLGEQARPAVRELIGALEDPKLHKPVAAVLLKIGADPAVRHLIDALKDTDQWVRLGAALALPQFGEEAKEAIEPLRKARAAENDRDMRKQMAEVLQHLQK
jgi:HEAT repeat protein